MVKMESKVLAKPLLLKTGSWGDYNGEFEGYGAVFGNQDFYGDIIMPGAFQDTLAQFKANNQTIPMRIMHGFDDMLPIGVWVDAEEDDQGLHLKGKLSAMDTERGKIIYELLKDGALRGLSIGFYLEDGNCEFIDGVRKITKINLVEVSLVDRPANSKALVQNFKSLSGFRSIVQPNEAISAIAQAIALYQDCLAGGDSPTADERDDLLAYLMSAYEALAGQSYNENAKITKNKNSELKSLIEGLTSATKLLSPAAPDSG